MKRKKSIKRENEAEFLIEAGNISAKTAIQESKAMNLTITYLEGKTIYKEWPDGKKEVVAVID
jgi:hypothetical protein